VNGYPGISFATNPQEKRLRMTHDSENPNFAEAEVSSASELIPVLMRLLRTIRHRKKVVSCWGGLLFSCDSLLRIDGEAADCRAKAGSVLLGGRP